MKTSLIICLAIFFFAVLDLSDARRKRNNSDVNRRQANLGGFGNGNGNGNGGGNGGGNGNGNTGVSAVCLASKLSKADGTQQTNGNCVSTAIGEVPSVDNMVSSFINEPKNAQILRANKQFTVTVLTKNLATGFFSDAATQYNTNSQKLNQQGQIQGHSHITVQKIDGQNAPDPKITAFFKGLNNAAVAGALTVEADPLPAGDYRICAMTGSFTHQPLVMPVANRGSQDDCIRVTMA